MYKRLLFVLSLAPPPSHRGVRGRIRIDIPLSGFGPAPARIRPRPRPGSGPLINSVVLGRPRPGSVPLINPMVLGRPGSGPLINSVVLGRPRPGSVRGCTIFWFSILALNAAGATPGAVVMAYLRVVTHFKFLIVGPDQKMVTKRH